MEQEEHVFFTIDIVGEMPTLKMFAPDMLIWIKKIKAENNPQKRHKLLKTAEESIKLAVSRAEEFHNRKKNDVGNGN